MDLPCYAWAPSQKTYFAGRFSSLLSACLVYLLGFFSTEAFAQVYSGPRNFYHPFDTSLNQFSATPNMAFQKKWYCENNPNAFTISTVNPWNGTPFLRLKWDGDHPCDDPPGGSIRLTTRNEWSLDYSSTNRGNTRALVPGTGWDFKWKGHNWFGWVERSSYGPGFPGPSAPARIAIWADTLCKGEHVSQIGGGYVSIRRLMYVNGSKVTWDFHYNHRQSIHQETQSDFKLGQWQKYVFYQYPSNGSDGKVRLWVDDVLAFSYNGPNSENYPLATNGQACHAFGKRVQLGPYSAPMSPSGNYGVFYNDYDEIRFVVEGPNASDPSQGINSPGYIAVDPAQTGQSIPPPAPPSNVGIEILDTN